MSTTVQDINILALPASTPIKKRYNIRFPQRDQKDVPQDDEWCEIIEEDTVTLIRFHAYAKVFRYAGLYDQLFGGPGSETQCVSPQVIARLLESQLHHHIPANDDHDPKHKTSLRVLDVGAGNGMMGEAIRGLARGGGAKIVGCDILRARGQGGSRARPPRGGCTTCTSPPTSQPSTRQAHLGLGSCATQVPSTSSR